jgi:hypothetical protein
VEDSSVIKTTWSSQQARTDCITSINEVLHQSVSRIICVVVVIEPTPIHSIAYIQHPETYPQFDVLYGEDIVLLCSNLYLTAMF